ncbi:Acyl-CoA dehydrogenase domain protein OS=Tsukamurella paurometabola (strain ATCC 8368 / DSM/ CCUG 35730 / CIP 100753 / JCM 10117 / KCTC 9821 / NBRC 16120/ NCIMB 702349 / NCTC 13040) OX=521096 GN=Tpau_3806 PE=3 SV=1 [Tsukamurella paurometabola]|uniref:Acyl-CoA dehydrogenase domain protein n=1 Tax=Tsukamurella paurometabola (strain ATCC 8368 / DSM 20162 / CCUG 35730 / CIP 100753 / JCM 10117 / KCTC 9821 / NBRC 16120 / NCIMB 702349 / NCTC 13040) TaxID=521096 RepID=D5UYT1_TSUPD|nr:acyl-CoA dehydrogenase family protein [Tsukamurella paurometabola]ADG80384.1 acyl-CoA dehydrogenase domain protein [Tsukamurella paurometabola DSM 20162]SUP39426.1 Acyl-CoA dehydrogenase fadE12 [Tsukamurella paurometabola]
MRIDHTPEQRELRATLRSYFEQLMTPERREAIIGGPSGEYGDGEVYKEITRKLGHDGWLAIGWPEEYGGQNRPMLDQLIFTDEAAIAGVPVPFLTVNTVGPAIMTGGTDEQKAKLLPGIAAGETHFSIGYSEPEAGTDLAALRTRAVRDGDDYVINGQKMWTSLIEYADYIWLAARTDPEAARHKGLSILIVPTASEGFSWTKVHTVAGPGTSATYYEDVRVPAASLVGELHGGWKLITNQLNHERVALTSAAPLLDSERQVRHWAQNTKLADGSRVIDAEWVQTHLARVYAHAQYLKLRNWKIAWAADHSELGPADASATKVFGTEYATEGYRLLMEVLGNAGIVRATSPGTLLRGRIERLHRSSLILTFGGGTNEVQRDLIAGAGLRLPVSR